MAYLLIPLDETIVFPTVTATLPIDVGDEERVFLLPRTDGEFGRVGVVAEVIERGQSRRGGPVATVVGLHRGIAGAAEAGDSDALRIDVQEIRDGHPDDEHTQELARSIMTDKQAAGILTSFPAERAAAISKKTMRDNRLP